MSVYFHKKPNQSQHEQPKNFKNIAVKFTRFQLIKRAQKF